MRTVSTWRKIVVVVALASAALPTLSMAMFISPASQFQRAREKGARAKVLVRVVDDDGMPVSNATVKVFFEMVLNPGSKVISTMTDTNGMAVAEGKTNVAIHFRVTKDGYYMSEDGIEMFNMSHRYEVDGGKWQPWGIDKAIVLRPRRNPVPIINTTKIYETLETNVWYGFDFKLSDFVKPHGKGEVADLNLMFEWDGKKPSRRPTTALHVTFDGRYAGGYHVAKCQQSLYPYIYRANTNDLFAVKTLDYNHRYEGEPGSGAWMGDQFDENKSIVLRSRCKVDEGGNLVSANFANITRLTYGAGWEGKGHLCISYFFNPTPNDPNLEPK